MVPQERLELSRLSAPASKTGVSTIPPPGLTKKLLNCTLEAFYYLAPRPGLEPGTYGLTESQASKILI